MDGLLVLVICWYGARRQQQLLQTHSSTVCTVAAAVRWLSNAVYIKLFFFYHILSTIHFTFQARTHIASRLLLLVDEDMRTCFRGERRHTKNFFVVSFPQSHHFQFIPSLISSLTQCKLRYRNLAHLNIKKNSHWWWRWWLLCCCSRFRELNGSAN